MSKTSRYSFRVRVVQWNQTSPCTGMQLGRKKTWSEHHLWSFCSFAMGKNISLWSNINTIRPLGCFDACYGLGEQRECVKWWKKMPLLDFCSLLCVHRNGFWTKVTQKGRQERWLLPNRARTLKQSQRRRQTRHPALLCWQTRASSYCAQSWIKTTGFYTSGEDKTSSNYLTLLVFIRDS